MQNPWSDLPGTDPFVLACDKPAIEVFNRRANPAHKIHLELFPEPYAGNPQAPIILLSLNPHFAKTNEQFPGDNPYFDQASRANRLHLPQAYRFYHLDPQLSGTAGGAYWRKMLKPLLTLYGVDTVARNLFEVEFFPYHSVSFGCPPYIASQFYSWRLVKNGVERGAAILLMRGKSLWFGAVPELDRYAHYYEATTPRVAVVSERNCPGAFPEICKILTAENRKAD